MTESLIQDSPHSGADAFPFRRLKADALLAAAGESDGYQLSEGEWSTALVALVEVAEAAYLKHHTPLRTSWDATRRLEQALARFDFLGVPGCARPLSAERDGAVNAKDNLPATGDGASSDLTDRQPDLIRNPRGDDILHRGDCNVLVGPCPCPRRDGKARNLSTTGGNP